MFFGLFGGKKKTPKTPEITKKLPSVKNKTESLSSNNIATNNVSTKATTTAAAPKKPVAAGQKTTAKSPPAKQEPVKAAPTPPTPKASNQENEVNTKEELNSCADFCTREEN